MSVKKTIKILAIILCIAGMLFGAAAMIWQQFIYKENEKRTETAIQTAALPKPPKPSSGESQISPVDNIPVPADPNAEWLLSVNMDELQAVNPEVTGWILIPDTGISHPLLQTKDNAYYLKHAWDGRKNSCGAIYMDYRSSLDDWNAVIYGHNMRNGSMFAEIRKYQDQQFMREHPFLYVLHNGTVRQYTLSAAFEAELDGVPYEFGPMDDNHKERFTERLKEKAGMDIPGPTVTLSTCTEMGHRTRWAVVFSLVSES